MIFVDKPDANTNPRRIQGVGEIDIVGTATAITSAIYHATWQSTLVKLWRR